MSTSCFHKVRAIAKPKGSGLELRSTRPATSPTTTPAAVVQAELDARAELNAAGFDYGTANVEAKLPRRGLPAPSRATLARIFAWEGVVIPEPGNFRGPHCPTIQRSGTGAWLSRWRDAVRDPYWNCSHVKDTPRPTFAGFAKHGRRRLQRRSGQRQHALERCVVDRNRHRGDPFAGDLLRDEPAEGMTDHDRTPIERGDGLEVVVGDLLDHLLRECLRVLAGLCHGGRVVGPAGGERDEPVSRTPRRRAAREEQRSCTNSAGVRSDAFGRTISVRGQSASVEVESWSYVSSSRRGRAGLSRQACTRRTTVRRRGALP